MMNFLFRLLFAGLLFLFADIKVIAQSNTAESSDSVVESLRSSAAPASLGDTALTKNNYHPEDGSIQEYKLDKDFAYMKYLDRLLRQTKNLTLDTFSIKNSNTTKRKNNSPPKSVNTFNLFSQSLVKIFLWLLAICFIGFLLYKLFNAGNFFKRNRSFKRSTDIQPEEESVPDVSTYDKLIAQAVTNKNFRLAVRYNYLQILQRLADAGVVQLSADKTNYQYVNELSNKPYQNDFAVLTSHYEYVWYGKFDITEETYNKLSNNFKTFSRYHNNL
jgi:hypothetical protein